jgi:GAF domain-containing protein
MTEASFYPADPRRNTRRYALLGVLFGLVFPLVATGVQLAAAGLPFTVANLAALQAQPIMWIVDTAPIVLGAFAAFAGRRQDLLEASSRLLEDQARGLQGGQEILERRVAERTAELERRDRQMLSAVQITRRLAQIRELPELLSTAVTLISESVPGFVADLYLLDLRSSEVVRATSSQAKHLPAVAVRVGEPGLIGQVAASGEPGRTDGGAAGQELAVPLLAHGRSIGVLHLRANTPSARLPGEADMVQLLADQLAAAIETSRLYGEARDALQQLQAFSTRAVQTDWKEQATSSRAAFEYTRAGIRPTQPGTDLSDPRSLRIFLELRGQRIGAITLARREAEGWTDADRDLAEKTATQVALALENVRLLEETRDRAAQEQRLSELSARLGQSVDLDTLLQTAVRELAALPEVAEASVYLNPAAAAPVKDSP